MPIDISTLFKWRPKVNTWNGHQFRRIERKMDGWRIFVAKDGAGERFAYARKEFNMALRFPWINWDAIPPNTIIEGELVACTGRASDVPTVLAGGMEGSFHPFAVPYFNNRAVPLFEERDDILQDLGLPIPHSVPVPPLTSSKDLEAFVKEYSTAHSIEGAVLKLFPWSDWYKIKPSLTMDCVVVGWKQHVHGRHKLGSLLVAVFRPGPDRGPGPSVARYQGPDSLGNLLGALGPAVVGALGPSVADLLGERVHLLGDVGSGFTAEQRLEFTRDKCIGRACEIGYDSITLKGKFRFPRFLRWRDDKPLEECTWRS